MITKWVKIDRATGAVVKQRTAEEMERVFDKPFVWIELERLAAPSFDADTEKLEPVATQADFSDLDVDVDPNEKRLESWAIVALAAAELQRRTNDRIAETDQLLTRIIEDIMVAIATGDPLERATFPDKVWDKINARRALRGAAVV